MEINIVNEIKIKQKTSKQVSLFFLSILMITASVYCVLLGFSFIENTFSGILSIRIVLFFVGFVGIIGVIFFGLCLLFIAYSLIKPKDILIINEKGFTDNSTIKSIGFISWDFVDDIYIFNFLDQKFISVKIKESSNIKIPKIDPFSKAEINITLNSTNENYDEVFENMQSFLYEYRSNKSTL